MARRGPKRKMVHREPNGKPQRPSVAQRQNDANARAALIVKNVVLGQPHRNGSEAKECATALGRFWLRLKTDNKVIYQAGEHYAGLVRRWRAAHGMVSAQAPEETFGTGEGPAWATVQGWLRDIRKIEAALDRAGCVIRFAVNRLVIDDRDPIDRQAEQDALVGLRIIALEVGLLGRDHPYR